MCRAVERLVGEEKKEAEEKAKVKTARRMPNSKKQTIDEVAEIAELPKDEVIRLSSEVK